MYFDQTYPHSFPSSSSPIQQAFLSQLYVLSVFLKESLITTILVSFVLL